MPILGTIASSRQVASAGAMTFLYTTTVSGGSTSAVSLSGFSGYDDIMVLASARTHSGSNADMAATVNNDVTANNYSGKILFASGSANGEANFIAANIYRFGYGCYPDMTANYYGNSMIYLHDYANTTTKKTIRWQAASPINTSSTNMIMGEAICSWNSTSAITSLQITMAPFGLNLADGSQFFVYGITR